ncbi:MAG: DNA polymerase III subunit psi [Gammaproteobacteria bacterium]|nr:DNA polymerase III subunit psi [Gammaproteobacteria bacterium]
MNLSKLQVDCLKAMGIPLWQLREPQDATAPVSKPILKPLLAPEILAVPKLKQVVQPPLLVAQLEQALSYCQKQSQQQSQRQTKQQTKQPAKLSWTIDDSLTQIIKKDNQLSLPNLTQVFASASLKRQLWQLISHPSE